VGLCRSNDFGQHADMRRFIPLLLIVAGYLLVASLYASRTPDWQAPDEPAHFNYIRQLSAGEIPVISPGDYDQEYQGLVLSSRFDRRYSVDRFEYEDHQPPLYYLIQTPIFLAAQGTLFPLRMVSVILGAGVVILSYMIARRLFPGREWLALATAAFVAFLPQHVAMMAAVNNDSLAELFIAAILLFLVDIVTAQRGKGSENREQRVSTGRWLILSLLLGLGFLTKATVYVMVPIIGIVLLWRYWGDWRSLMRNALFVFGLAVLLGLVWWGRNVAVYGGLDVMGTAAHNSVVVGQPRTSEWIAERGIGATLSALIQTTFQSFWGQFGWMGVVMPTWVYRPLLIFSFLTIIGLLGVVTIGRDRIFRAEFGGQGAVYSPAVMILVSTLALSLLLFLGYNATFVQHQGRYLFPALIPIAVGVAIGWSFFLDPVTRRWPKVAYVFPIVLAFSLFALDLIALYRFIVPSLS
jgi:4-amino-4-deoxy-L-arabinose transferase-like glycosyltransferase